MTTQPKKSNRRRIIILVGGLLILCAVGSYVSSLFTDTEPEADVAGVVTEAADDEPTAAPEPTTVPTDEPTAAPTATTEPTAVPPTLAPDEALRAAVADALGDSNRDVERLVGVVDDAGRIEVDWAINDNVGEDMVKGGAQLDATEILKAIVASGYAYEFVLMRGTFPLVDQFGNIEEQKVVELFFEKPTVDQINFDNFDHRNVYDIADSAQIHPAFVRE